MPSFPDMGARNIADLTEFLITGKDKGADPAVTADPSWLKYRIDASVPVLLVDEAETISDDAEHDRLVAAAG